MKTRIAITGGIGSGKSTVSSILKELGYPTFSCDEIYKTLMDTKEYIAEIERLFPNAVINGKIDKKALSTLVFGDEYARRQLNNLAHPLIMKVLFEHMNECAEEITFAEVPLLFEGNYQNLFDGVIVVVRSLINRVQAVMQRDSVSSQEVESRIKTQNVYDIEKLKRQHDNLYVLHNDGSLEQLKINLTEIIKNLS